MNRKILCSIIIITLFVCGLGITDLNPNAASLRATKITKCVSNEVGKMTVSWKTISKADGYQIKITKDKNFKKSVSTFNTKNKSKMTIKNLTCGQGYYVKVRAYDTVKNKKVYSSWTTRKYVKIKTHKHNYKVVSKTTPTCIQDGTEKSKCSCGLMKVKTFKKTGHNYKLVTETKPTCTTNGLKTYECRCGLSKSETINCTGHNYIENVNGTMVVYNCSNCDNSYTIPNTTSMDKEYVINYGNGVTKKVIGHFDREQSNEILILVNEYRLENDLQKLKKGNSNLQEAADIRSCEIVEEFSHTRPNGRRAIESFENTNTCAENIGRYQKNPNEIVNGWINSPGHNRVLLKEDANSVSIGVFAEKQPSGNYYYHYVGLFSF